jgi:hypothetical protein
MGTVLGFWSVCLVFALIWFPSLSLSCVSVSLGGIIIYTCLSVVSVSSHHHSFFFLWFSICFWLLGMYFSCFCLFLPTPCFLDAVWLFVLVGFSLDSLLHSRIPPGWMLSPIFSFFFVFSWIFLASTEFLILLPSPRITAAFCTQTRTHAQNTLPFWITFYLSYIYIDWVERAGGFWEHIKLLLYLPIYGTK